MCLTSLPSAGRAALQHVLDQVDAAARAVELVAEQHIGRAGRGAEAAMHAGAQDLAPTRAMSGSASCAGVKLVCMPIGRLAIP